MLETGHKAWGQGADFFLQEDHSLLLKERAPFT